MSSKDDPVFVQQGGELTQERRHARLIDCIRRLDFKAEKW